MLEPKARGIVENAAAFAQQAVDELNKIIVSGEGQIDCNSCYRAIKGTFFQLINLRDMLADLADENYEPEEDGFDEA